VAATAGRLPATGGTIPVGLAALGVAGGLVAARAARVRGLAGAPGAGVATQTTDDRPADPIDTKGGRS